MTDAAATNTTPATLDDVMLAMDVVDTLRHREALVAQELAGPERDAQLLEKLRNLYASQGIDVTDEILKEGIKALQEDRFVYHPTKRASGTRWAYVYVNRAAWLKSLLALVIVAAIAVFAYWTLIENPKRQFVKNVDVVYAEAVAASKTPTADARAAELYDATTTANSRGDRSEARDGYARLQDLRDQLEASYTLRIAMSPTTGFWRVPDVNPNARNYYVVVEAIDANGKPVTVPVLDEETNKVNRVSAWGVRVDEATFESVRDDKLDDGIIQNDTFGRKAAGYLEPEYYFPTSGAAMTNLSEI